MDLGEKSGQEYDVAAGIKTFLGQMSEGGIDIAAAIIKELLQNADDAQATEVTVVLDERTRIPELPAEEYKRIIAPALLVTNNAYFKLPEDVSENEKDDFSAIKSVASGHKAGQATSAGRFGIGFNSVYFITDNPIIFSRREIHIFDLLHKVYDVNGWKFSLDDFPASSPSLVGPVKSVIQWMFPQSIANFKPSFGEISKDSNGDYKRTIFRLPLRQPDKSLLNPLFNRHFKDSDEREKLLRDMASQAAKSILFLNYVKSISFRIIPENAVDNTPYNVAEITASPYPEEFYGFIKSVKAKSSTQEIAKDEDKFNFLRTIKYNVIDEHGNESKNKWSFKIYHSARFENVELNDLRKKLSLNQERATPWASLAIPLDKPSFNFDTNNGSNPYWRVFLPLLEEGPSACVYSAALFVGPSRQRAEYVTTEASDEALRKTDWNKALVNRVLVPLLRDASLDIPADFIKEYPVDYLSYFPVSKDIISQPKSLNEYLQKIFCYDPWYLQIYDIWGDKIELDVGGESTLIKLEMIPEWLIKYQERFKMLSDDTRKFIPYSIGDAVKNRIPNQQNISIVRDILSDVAVSVLKYDSPPTPEDLVKLLNRLDLSVAESDKTISPLDELWCFVREQDKQVLRYQGNFLYIAQNSNQKSSIHQCLQDLKFKFSKTEWIDPQFGFPATKQGISQSMGYFEPADDSSALKLLSRVENGFKHDKFRHVDDIVPIIDFLCDLDETIALRDLQLGFLVKTAHGKENRRSMGVILLKPPNPTHTEEALWEGVFRRTYAEVDPEFTREITRLLSIRPDCLKMLHSPDCSVIVANEDAFLEVFYTSRKNCNEESFKQQTDKIEVEMNGVAAKKGLAENISSAIIDEYNLDI
jgi:hypothetical protein